MLDAAGMEQETGLRRTPPFGRLANRPLRHAGHLGRLCRRPLTAVLRDLFEPYRPRVDELAIDPVVLDHEVQYARKERRIAPRPDRQEQITRAGRRRDARILEDDPRALLARLPEVVGGDGRTLRHVRARDPDDLRADHVGPGVRRTIDAERFLVRGAGADHAETSVVVDER